MDETKFREQKTAELAAIIQDFLQTDIGRRFKSTPERWSFLYHCLEKAKIKVSVAALVSMTAQLHNLKYDILTPSAEELARAEQIKENTRRAEAAKAANSPEAIAAREKKAADDAVKAERAYFAQIEIALPGENSLQTLQRVARLKDAYRRSRLPAPVLPSSTPHPDTIRNTRNEIRGRHAEAERQRLSRNTPAIIPDVTTNQPRPGLLVHDQNDEVRATSQAEAERTKK